MGNVVTFDASKKSNVLDRQSLIAKTLKIMSALKDEQDVMERMKLMSVISANITQLGGDAPQPNSNNTGKKENIRCVSLRTSNRSTSDKNH